MDTIGSSRNNITRWRCTLLTLYIMLLATHCQGESHTDITKTDVKLDNKLDSIHCHSCYSSSNKESPVDNYKNYIKDFVDTLSTYADKDFNLNKTVVRLERAVETMLDEALTQDRYKIFEGIEIKVEQANGTSANVNKTESDIGEGRELFSKFTYEYRLFQKVKDFVNRHILSINLPMAAKCKYLNEITMILIPSDNMFFFSCFFLKGTRFNTLNKIKPMEVAALYEMILIL